METEKIEIQLDEMHETEIDITGENIHIHQIIRKKSFSCELPGDSTLSGLRTNRRCSVVGGGETCSSLGCVV